MTLSFTIPGRVSGKGRPKFARRGNFVTAYTPEKTRTMESVVRDFASQAMRGKELIVGPVSLEICALLHPAESWSKKRKAAAKWVTGKPDCDNIVKLCGDSLNGIVWKDDSQISLLSFSRRYVQSGPEEVRITVTSLDGA